VLLHGARSKNRIVECPKTKAKDLKKTEKKEKQSGMRPPKHLVMGQDDMAKAWKIWVRQFDWYAAASRFTLKDAEVQV
jgi:hypothetical protein